LGKHLLASDLIRRSELRGRFRTSLIAPAWHFLSSSIASSNDCIWTPPHFASTPSSGDEVRLLTYIRPLSDLDQPRSGHDGLCARRLLIALPGFSPVDIPRLFRRRFDLFAIPRSARNRGDTLLDQSGRAASGRHVFRFVVRAMPQHRPRDSGQLVCERRRRNVRM